MHYVANFQISFYQFLDEQGKLNVDLFEIFPELINNHQGLLIELLKIYTHMLKTRLFDAKAINLQRTGKLGTYPSCLWHEAIGVAIGSSMRDEDLFCPYYRDLGTMLWRKVLMEEILAYWGGFQNGNNFKYALHDFPICVPIASQTLHAVGAAFTFKYKKEPRVVVTTVGDGGTSRGDFYEALNLAKLWELPIVFLIINNRWAISTPTVMQTKAETFAQKAIAAGIVGEQVDGNDVFALKNRLKFAIEKARSNNGPSVIEALTYRMGDHTTADDSGRYRDEQEKQAAIPTDPLLRLKIFLQEQYNFSKEEELEITQECQTRIETAVNNYLSLELDPASSMFDHLYKTLPKALKAQRDLL